MCLSRMAGVPYGGSWHAVDIWKDRNLLAEKIRGAAIILTCTRHNHDHLAGIAPDRADAIRLAYHGIPFNALEALAPSPPPKGDPVILAVGRLVPKKGFDHLLRACALLKGEGVRFAVRIVGEGPESGSLRALASGLGVADRVIWEGSLPNAEVLDCVRGAALLAAPSVPGADGNIDGIPNVILEAMALERPVVASDFSGIPEAVKPGETGLLFPPGDAPALAAALRALLADREGACRMGRAAAMLVRERFDAGRNARRQLEMVRAALEEPTVQPGGAFQRGGSKS
jgi:glycosyltransferase involved in cell wall biosynthesis